MLVWIVLNLLSIAGAFVAGFAKAQRDYHAGRPLARRIEQIFAIEELEK